MCSKILFLFLPVDRASVVIWISSSSGMSSSRRFVMSRCAGDNDAFILFIYDFSYFVGGKGVFGGRYIVVLFFAAF